ncbi:MAG: hypothetical protein MI808_02615 [Pseudomonadales bacterium]|nr:hypothetical protein [Pseudomonadales bacterium]
MKFVRVAGVVLATIVCVSFADEAIEALQGSAPEQNDSRRLDGLWISNCFEFEAGVYQVRSFEFVLNHLATITTMTYPDARCEQHPVGSDTVSATWDMGSVYTTSEGLDVVELDVLLKAGPRQELTTVKQAVYFQPGSFVLGINKQLDVYPDKLDWDISYTAMN